MSVLKWAQLWSTTILEEFESNMSIGYHGTIYIYWVFVSWYFAIPGVNIGIETSESVF